MRTFQESKEGDRPELMTPQQADHKLENCHFAPVKTNQLGNHPETLLSPHFVYRLFKKFKWNSPGINAIFTAVMDL